MVMHRLIPVSDETGITLVGTYDAASAANPGVPYKWRIFYGIPGERSLVRQTSRLTEPQLSAKLQHQALHYISAHLTAPVAVAFHNTLRLFELEGTLAWRAAAAAISLPTSVARDGVVGFWIVCGLALSVVLVNVETPRFRAAIDPFPILLASAGLSAAATRIWARLRDRAPVRGEAWDAVATRPGELVEMRECLA
jgi:hypothetical protein